MIRLLVSTDECTVFHTFVHLLQLQISCVSICFLHCSEPTNCLSPHLFYARNTPLIPDRKRTLLRAAKVNVVFIRLLAILLTRVLPRTLVPGSVFSRDYTSNNQTSADCQTA